MKFILNLKLDSTQSRIAGLKDDSAVIPSPKCPAPPISRKKSVPFIRMSVIYRGASCKKWKKGRCTEQEMIRTEKRLNP